MEPTKPAIGPISPELVLVDPDLGAGARAALPDYPWPAPVRIEPREPARHRRIPVAAAFSFLSFAALVGILGVSLLPTRDQPTFAAEGRRTLARSSVYYYWGKPAPRRAVSYHRGKLAAAAPESRIRAGRGGRRPEKSGGEAGTVGRAQAATVQTRSDVRLGASGACGLLPGCPFSETAGASTRRGLAPRG